MNNQKIVFDAFAIFVYLNKEKGKYPISYADAFAVNLALSYKIPIVTGDPEIKKLARQNKNLKILWSQ